MKCENICLSGYCLVTAVQNQYILERRQMILEQAPEEQEYLVRKTQQKKKVVKRGTEMYQYISVTGKRSGLV